MRDTQKYLEDSILKLNYKSFTQIVILGSASFTPFMQLPQSSRREIIEDILDIQIFTTMNTLLKEKINVLKTEISKIEGELELAKHKTKVQKEYIDTLESDKAKKLKDLEEQINDIRRRLTKQKMKLSQGRRRNWNLAIRKRNNENLINTEENFQIKSSKQKEN